MCCNLSLVLAQGCIMGLTDVVVTIIDSGKILRSDNHPAHRRGSEEVHEVLFVCMRFADEERLYYRYTEYAFSNQLDQVCSISSATSQEAPAKTVRKTVTDD